MTDSSPIHLQNSIGPSICDWAEKRVTYFTSASRTRGLLFCMGRNSGQIHNHIENIMTPACRPRTDASIWLYALFTFFSFFLCTVHTSPARVKSVLGQHVFYWGQIWSLATIKIPIQQPVVREESGSFRSLTRWFCIERTCQRSPDAKTAFTFQIISKPVPKIPCYEPQLGQNGTITAWLKSVVSSRRSKPRLVSRR